MADPKEVSPQEVYNTYVRLQGTIRGTALELGISRTAVQNRLKTAYEEMGFEWEKPLVGGKIDAFKTIKRPLPRKGKIARYIITSAQNNTFAHAAFFNNLKAYAEHIDAEIMVSQYAYDKASYGNRSVKPGKGPTYLDEADTWYDPIFEPYFCGDRVELAPMLVFCGEVNIMPTAKRPLSSFETYTKRASAIFGHAKIAMESIAGPVDDGAKFNYTTGTATAMNYIQKKAGLQAEFHHSYGAVIAEVDYKGTWFVRHLNADKNGDFFDLTTEVCNGSIIDGVSVEAINWGDIHTDVIDEEVKEIAFGDGGMLDTLQPGHQFAHDLLDFYTRNHHEIKNCHAMFKRYAEERYTVRDEVIRAKEMLDEMGRPWCTTVVVDSNHDNAMLRWLEEADYKKDPPNAIYFLECQLEVYRALDRGDENYHVVREALRREGCSHDILFLGPDDSFVLCDDGSGGIEYGMHGHLGPNGSRGTPLGLSRMGRRANTGHTHSARIVDGLYVAGTMTKLRLDYTKGPSSWSHSMIVTYRNGKRAIITVRDGKWRATP